MSCPACSVGKVASGKLVCALCWQRISPARQMELRWARRRVRLARDRDAARQLRRELRDLQADTIDSLQ